MPPEPDSASRADRPRWGRLALAALLFTGGVAVIVIASVDRFLAGDDRWSRGVAAFLALVASLLLASTEHTRLLRQLLRQRTDELDSARRDLTASVEALTSGFARYRVQRDPEGRATSFICEYINTAGRLPDAPDTEHLIGQDLLDFFPDSAHNGLAAALARAADTGLAQWTRITVSGESYLQVLDGTHTRIDRDTVVSSWQNVRAELEAHALLERAYEDTAMARAILETALDAASDPFAVWAVDRADPGQTRLLAANQAITRIFPMTKDEAVGLDLATICAADGPEVIQRVHTDLVTALERYRPVDCADVTLSDGLVWRPTVNRVGEDDVVVLSLRDVTRLVSETRALQEQRDAAADVARRDPLTGLANRLSLTEQLNRLASALDDPDEIAVAFIDLDGFKVVNDTYGHDIGDELLTVVARRLQQLVRRQDTVGRLAGDEFLILLSGLPAGWNPEQFSERVVRCLSQPVTTVSGHQLGIGASVGIVVTPPAIRNAPALLAAADAAMYDHKRLRKRASLPT